MGNVCYRSFPGDIFLVVLPGTFEWGTSMTLQMIEERCGCVFFKSSLDLPSCQDRMIEMGLVEWVSWYIHAEWSNGLVVRCGRVLAKAVYVLGSPTDEAQQIFGCVYRGLRVPLLRVIYVTSPLFTKKS